MEIRFRIRCIFIILVHSRSTLTQMAEMPQQQCGDVCKYTSWAFDADCKDVNLASVPTQCHQARTLDLRHNPIHILPSGIFEGFVQLRYLDIEMIQLEVIDPGAFRDNINLIHIYLQENSLTVIHSFTFKGAPNLTQLFLNNNDIHTLENGAFDGITQLQTLFLSDNNITEISADLFHNLTNLRYLYIDNNRISNIGEGAFKYLSNLRHLSLAGNTLSHIPQGALDSLKHLRALKLSFNQIISVGPLPKLSKLTHIDLFNNKLTSIQNLTNILNISKTSQEIHLPAREEKFTNVYLGKNPLNCTCDIEPLRVWLVTHLERIQNHRANATCASPVQFANVPVSKQSIFCPKPTTTIKFQQIKPVRNAFDIKPSLEAPNNHPNSDLHVPKQGLMPITIVMVTVSCIVLFSLMLWVVFARLSLKTRNGQKTKCSDEKTVNITSNHGYESV